MRNQEKAAQSRDTRQAGEHTLRFGSLLMASLSQLVVTRRSM